MIYCGFSLDIPLFTCKALYERFLRGSAPHRVLEKIGMEGRISKNGTRTKKYQVNGKLYFFTIQRMKIEGKYIDLFPLCLIPESRGIASDLMYEENGTLHHKKKYENSFERWMRENDIDLFSLKGFCLLKSYKEYSIYRSEKKLINFVSKRGGIQANFIEEYIYVIRMNLSAQVAFS